MAIQLRRGEYSNFDPTKLLAGEVAVVQGGDNATSSGKTAYLSFGSGTVKRLVTEEELGQVADDLDDHITDFEGDVAALEQTLGNISSTATAALTKANDNENAIAETNTAIAQLRTELDNVSINPDDLGLYQDPDTYYVYPTYKDVVSENGIPLAASGGGGGGGSSTNAVLTVTNTTGWLSKTIAFGTDCVISVNWSSIEDELPTGNGTIRITVGDVVKTSYEIEQGSVSVNLKPYINKGSNKVKVRISDIYDQGKTITFTITAAELSISSSFDPSVPCEGAFSFPYTPVGEVQKTVHFVLDNVELETVSTSASGRQLTTLIPAQTHGAHKLSCYFTATINNETVYSNTLYYEFMSVVSGTSTPIITSQYNTSSVEQYTTIQIPYQVYTPNSLTSSVSIYANNTLQTTLTVDRTEQIYSYRADSYGALAIKIQSGSVYKTINITVTESSIDVEAETENLALFLNSYGRSNSEANPDTWTYGTGNNAISATFSGFNWTSDGWVTDSDGITVLRCAGTARVTIPYKPFASDFRTSGKTIEIEFATRNVLDYDAVIMSCFSGDRGFKLTAQKALLKSEQSEISTQYKEDEHIRIAFVAEKRARNRLLYVYINAIPSGVVQYDVNDDFSQTSPVNISIGSSDCTIDIYCIRIYDNDLTSYQILDNWIADTQVGATMLERYTRNNVFDAYDNIVIEKLPDNLPYFILNAPQLPQFKGDNKTITGSYTDRLTPSKSFTFEGCKINVQGTSSAKYSRKNYDLQFKQGFELSTGHADNYELRTGEIPFNRFVLKADVASSEGANNVELVRLYNDACPYKTAEMVGDSRVRWGIDGFPVVVFWNNTDTGTVSFLGKYNFNLPKRAPAPYGYANDNTLESWEFQNNRSALMLFQTDYFDETMYTDPETGETKELWRYDYEARFPSDAWTNYAKLQELQSFIYSTYRDEATNDDLDQSVTYDGVAYTKDTEAYRLAKFKAEFPTYAELNSFIFYYVFTELFLMVDSRAKNLFIGFNGSAVTASNRVATRKATAQPYDMDTALGTNNEGALVFSYNLEDTDTLTGGHKIFNGQDSVLWCNLRDAFSTEIQQMYQSLRSVGTISYNTLESRYEAHQEKWPEAIWIEDSRFKYIDPLINPNDGDEPSAFYLPMMQGSKEQQRKWWLSNRFKYMDSKWNAGDAYTSVIQLRAYSKANISVTPYADIYATVTYGSYTVSSRATRGQATTLQCPSQITVFDDTELYIYSASQIASVGDLSGLKIGFADFSAAIRLQSIKVGDSDSNYENTRLKTLTLGNNALLQTVDARNCTALGSDSQKSIDLSGCPIIENVYLTGTQIAGVNLPNGGVLKVLQLPDTITNLTVLNQNQITTFSVENDDYSNISTLRIENCSSTIPVMDILEDMSANSRVRIIGFTMTVSSTDDVEDFFDYLDTMRGLDENGNNLDNAVVSGTINGLGTISGSWVAQMKARYPNVNYGYEHISCTLKYYNGSTLINTETVLDNGNGTYTGTPSKTATAQYTYTFAGWSKDADDNTVDSDALQHVDSDRNVYACFTSTVRTYTVYFYNGTSLISGATVYNVPYGGSATYTGSTPVSPDDPSEEFIGWSPQPTNITGDTSCYAQYGEADIPIVEPDLKYLVYTTDDVNMTMTITGLNIAQIVADRLATLTIPDTIQGYHVILD